MSARITHRDLPCYIGFLGSLHQVNNGVSFRIKIAATGIRVQGKLSFGKIFPLMSQPGARTPHENFYFFAGGRRNPRLPNMKAIRHGNWKLWLKMEDGGRLHGTELYNLGNDVGEKHDVSARHPDLVRRLEKMAQAFEDDLRQHIRPLGRLKE